MFYAIVTTVWAAISEEAELEVVLLPGAGEVLPVAGMRQGGNKISLDESGRM